MAWCLVKSTEITLPFTVVIISGRGIRENAAEGNVRNQSWPILKGVSWMDCGRQRRYQGSTFLAGDRTGYFQRHRRTYPCHTLEFNARFTARRVSRCFGEYKSPLVIRMKSVEIRLLPSGNCCFFILLWSALRLWTARHRPCDKLGSDVMILTNYEVEQVHMLLSIWASRD
jgi:hypothetical protein